MEKEVRYLQLEYREIPDNDRHVEGYALVFNSESRDLGGFVEIIDPTALKGVLEVSDVICFLNHNEDKGVLARSTNMKGSLKLEVDATGLKYSFDAPNTALGDELLEGLKRGDIRSSSFAFKVEKDQWIKKENRTYVRKILKFKELIDVSPVYKPAYEATDVAKRSLNDFQESDDKHIEEVISFYDDLKKQFEFIN